MTANSLLEQPAQRLAARDARDDVLPELLEHRLERQQLVGPVVDHQDVDLVAAVARGFSRGDWRP